LRNPDGQGQQWIRLDLSAPANGERVAMEEWRRFHAPEELRRAVAGVVAPGTTIIVTPDSLEAGGEPVGVLEAEAPQTN
jgi:hypothetical protein